MKKTDIKGLNASELQEKIAAEKQNLQRLEFAHAISPIENPMKIREARKTIARLNTELSVKQK
jgi:large subunit ribosomal protein L29